jgi:hypothetical protein
MVHAKPVVGSLLLGTAAFVFDEALEEAEVLVVVLEVGCEETPDDVAVVVGVVLVPVVGWLALEGPVVGPVVGWLALEGPVAEGDDADFAPLDTDASKEPVMASSVKKGENPTYEVPDVGTNAM